MSGLFPEKSEARLVRLALVIAVVVATAQLGTSITATWRDRSLFALWPNPESQSRMALGDVPYDLLSRAAVELPRETGIVLVTSARDVRHLQYTTFHRALYMLAPRAVWWTTSAPADGTWESRWWITRPITPTEICALAREKGAGAAVLFAVDIPDPGPDSSCGRWTRVAAPGGTIVLLDPSVQVRGGSPESARTPALWWLRIAGAIAIILMLGSAIATLIGRVRPARGSRIEHLGLAWALGCGCLTLVLAVGNAVGMGLESLLVVVTVLAIAAAIWSQRARPPAAKLIPSRERRSVLDWCLAVILALQVAVVAINAMGRPLVAWDSWVTWGMKARLIHEAGGITSGLFTDPSRAVTQLDYPLLFPLAQAWVYQWLGAPDDRLAGAIVAGFYLALIAVLYAGLRRSSVDRTVALAAVVVAAVGSYVATLAGNGYADAPVAVYLAIITVYGMEALDGRPRAAVIAAIGAGLLLWTKREGLILVPVAVTALVGLGAATGTGRRAMRLALVVTGSAILVAAPWWVFMAANGVENAAFASPTGRAALENAERLPTIVLMLGKTLMSLRWNLAWVLGLGLLVGQVLRRRPARLTDAPMAIAILYLALASTSYMFSTYEPYRAHVASSVFRLVAQVTPLTVLWVVLHQRRVPVTASIAS